jgi:hypothetical protein
MNTDTERARFEKWAEDEGYSLAVWAGGRYQSDTTESLWAAWQARAALPSAPSEGPSDKERVKQLEDAIRWALGEGDDFPPRMEGQGKYWWRTELRLRAAIKASTP